MTSNLDIYRSANGLIEQQGDDAPIHAAMRADELMAAGDMDDRAVWLRIVKAIEDLLSKERPKGEKVHQTPQEARTCALSPSRVLRTPNPTTRILSHPSGVWLTFRSLPQRGVPKIGDCHTGK